MSYRYENSILKKLQETELGMLQVLDRICTKYGITYFVTFGTAIGAVRHQGFIPWDDDVDIGMMREEYEKLLLVPKDEWGDLFLVDPADNYSLHRTIYPRIYKKNTIFETKYHYDYSITRENNEDKHLPIWLDIFVYDRVPSAKWVKDRLILTFVLRKFYYWSKCKIRIRKEDTLKKQTVCLMKRVAFYFLNLVKRPELIIRNAFVKTVSNGSGEFVTSFELDYNYEVMNSILKYEDMFPTVRLNFENTSISVVKNYDEMLSNLYGDYMQIPPEEKRINHPPAILDFGNGKNEISN